MILHSSFRGVGHPIHMKKFKQLLLAQTSPLDQLADARSTACLLSASTPSLRCFVSSNQQQVERPPFVSFRASVHKKSPSKTLFSININLQPRPLNLQKQRKKHRTIQLNFLTILVYSHLILRSGFRLLGFS